ncbi:hypothetical protein ASPZODRAFT_62962 [Penicilliopsis zonata CBS 506.65]|uniref:Swiss Army Knife RNA repair protein HAD domain-containing protein n=1 Tax=Penicilliopsis zonata CBS 506.65 TaxID=1073090 RepID=A0A1L9SNG7_9EURO|nr:hypothetical protein ASPZODRAFT_62962 [Penicilliopsis zonata CBS 506.65]OJJ48666.1 hypothetical protein ASPZODRAFT_62962 [Penicilliopsis zonata CBS 506.65]
MAPGQANGSLHANQQREPLRTITNLRRWSILNKEIPAVSQVKAVHVYDFDNTLFMSPLPNPQLWNGSTIGFLQAYESFANGGWWHDPNLLAATGEGVDIEEPRAWEGWWNEHIARLVSLSMEQKDALTVLLTGRSENGFAELIKRIVASKKLDFDLICLKPEVGPNSEQFASTMNFKQSFLEDLILTYQQADEIRVYEDRPKHTKGFREFFEQLNRKFQSSQGSLLRMPIHAEVIQVAEGCAYLSPVTETAEVQRMINSHNLILQNQSLNRSKSPFGRLRIKRTIFYTGYLISSVDATRLINQVLTPILPPGLAESNDIKYMANSILITPRPAQKTILDRVGGLGKKLTWQITGTGNFENRVWAARVSPIPHGQQVYTENPIPVIVLAIRKGARPIDAGKIHNWHPIPADRDLTVETVIGEKMVLRVEQDNPHEGEWESQFMNKSHKRRHQQERDEDILYPQSRAPSAPNASSFHPPEGPSYYNPRSNNHYSRHDYHDDGPLPRRGGSSRGRGRGNSRGRGGRGRGRGRGNRGGAAGGDQSGPPGGYRSLDDYGGFEPGNDDKRGGPNGGAPVMNY